MKIPRKADLISLQIRYKSDAKIAEAMGGIPEYLVAYWRRKKGVEPYSAPKFSREQILELWERYGDDFRCGRELNISKAAFYSWRRKYGILEKPVSLRLEQLELRLAKANESTDASAEPPEDTGAKTSTEKIRIHCRDRWPHASEPVDWHIAPRGAETNAPLVISPGPVLRWPRADPDRVGGELGSGGVRDPLWCLPDRGSILWQLIEVGTIPPGHLLSGPRMTVGGLGGVGSLVLDETAGATDLHTIKVEVTRRLPIHVDVEDILLAMVSHGWCGEWGHAVVEFSGVPIERLSVDRKAKLCAITVQAGALAAICPFDESIRRHYGRILQGHFPQTHADRTARYDAEHFLEGHGITPGVGGMGVQGRLSVLLKGEIGPGGVIVGPEALPYEIETTAALVQGRALDPQGPGALLVCPATQSVYRLAQRRGWTQTILDAGGSVLDIGLTRRLGLSGLIRVARGRATSEAATVYFTQPVEFDTQDPTVRTLFAGGKTALARSGLLS
ncbi:MAG: hypothetical protein HY304_06215 [candidate division Zixibacteria bacterium]|nr:hypothetical protein [candidate division Zixibacteria bacterium]